MIEVKPIDAGEIHRFYKGQFKFNVPVLGYAARKGLMTSGLGGIWQEIDGRVWGFMAFKPGHRGGFFYRYAKLFLAEAERSGIPEIYVVRDHRLPTSERLLRRCGFTITEEKIADFWVWVWRNPRMKDNG